MGSSPSVTISSSGEKKHGNVTSASAVRRCVGRPAKPAWRATVPSIRNLATSA